MSLIGTDEDAPTGANLYNARHLEKLKEPKP